MIIGLPTIYGVSWTCNFSSQDWGGYGVIYCCSVAFSEATNNDNILDIQGPHKTGYSDEDVLAFKIWHLNTPFLHNGIGHFFPNVQTMQVCRVELKEVSKEIFEGFNNLTNLNLNYNVLKEIKVDTFDHIPNLTNIYLEENRIETLSADVFVKLKFLEHINLNRNKLTHLLDGTFRNNELLNTVLLNQNQLSSMTPRIFNNVNVLKTVELRDNRCIRFDVKYKSEIDDLRILIGLCNVTSCENVVSA